MGTRVFIIQFSLLLHVFESVHNKQNIFCFFETESQSVAQADPEIEILLPQPPKCWDYRYASLYRV
jgi:hypothetical protein